MDVVAVVIKMGGRKRSRRRSSDESADTDSDIETIIVDKKNYGLRPRRSQLLTKDLSDEEENQYESDFEDELTGDTLITTVRHEATEQPPSHLLGTGTREDECVDYDDAISASEIGDKNQIDFESFIEKTEIQVHKRKQEPPPEREEKRKKRGRRPKWVENANDCNNEFFHFLDTRDSNVEDLIDIAPALDYIDEIEQREIQTTESDNKRADEVIAEIKSESNEMIAFESLVETCEQNLTESERPLDAVVKDEAESETVIKEEIDYGDVENLEAVIETAREILNVDETVHSWSGITSAMSDKSYFLESDGEVAVLKENAPKAQFHYLIIPKENLKSLHELNSSHVPVIEHMYNTAKRIIAYPHHKNAGFLIGFNALPAMIIYQQKFYWLHLHVLSNDMNFENLLLKKHWNSIHTSLFIHPEGSNFFM